MDDFSASDTETDECQHPLLHQQDSNKVEKGEPEQSCKLS